MSFSPTSLYLACEKENMPVLQALLKYGADPARKILCWGRDGPSALERVRSINTTSCLKKSLVSELDVVIVGP
jgi:hypothetical protein